MTQLIKEVEPKGNRNETHPTEENLVELVEDPLLQACIGLVRKNIRTVASTANKNNIGHNAELLISADDVSYENQEMARRLGAEEFNSAHWGRVFVFKYPLNENSTVDEVEVHFEEIAKAFQTQPYTWADKRNFAETLEMIGLGEITPEIKEWLRTEQEVVDSNGRTWNWDEMVKEAVSQGEYYDEKTGYLYANQAEYERERNSTL